MRCATAGTIAVARKTFLQQPVNGRSDSSGAPFFERSE
jgi:hypothetical protein